MGIIKKEFYFTEIDCPVCAGKVEALLNKEECITYARINFPAKKVIVEYQEEVDIKPLIQKLARKIEPYARILTKEEYDYLGGKVELAHHHHHHDGECEGGECSCEKEHHHHKKVNINLIIFIIGLALFITSIVLDKGFSIKLPARIISFVSFILISYDIIFKSLKNIGNGNIFDENFLMMVASIGALIINEPIEAHLVVILYKIGVYFENKALDQSTRAISSLASLKSDTALLDTGDVVDVDDVKIGDIIVVKVGEKIPLDGIIISGTTTLDMKALTGESIPVDKNQGEEVLSGSINLSSVILVKVTAVYSDSTASKIIKLVDEATSKKSKTEEFITKFARIYTPVVLLSALAVFLVEWLLLSDKFTLVDALNNTFVFLVTSCPCALCISIPLGFYAGIGRASTYGILVKGGNYIEALAKVDTVVFDKTGTLTKGNFNVTEINSKIDKDQFMQILSSLESYSNHPVAKSVAEYYKGEKLTFTDVKEISGEGLIGNLDGKIVLAGNMKLLKDNNITAENIDEIGTIIYLVVDNEVLGHAIVFDELKESTLPMIKALRDKKIKTIMLTGDRSVIANKVKDMLGIDECYSELMPKDKMAHLEDIIKNKKGNIAYIGDGINDTPAIRIADVGIAVGRTDAAIESADMVLSHDDMTSLNKALDIAKFTKKTIKFNIIFALAVKLIALVVGALGILGSYGMLLGIFADVGVTLIAVLVTLRILRFRGK